MVFRVAAVLCMLMLAACGQGGNASGPAATAAPNASRVVGLNGVEGEINGRIVPGSKFSRIKIGMVSREVESLIGQPTDTAGHITGKSFIPFYFGGDTTRVESFYRGEGQLTYSHESIGSSTLILIAITADPSERGFAH